MPAACSALLSQRDCPMTAEICTWPAEMQPHNSWQEALMVGTLMDCFDACWEAIKRTSTNLHQPASTPFSDMAHLLKTSTALPPYLHQACICQARPRQGQRGGARSEPVQNM